ncbi:MAG: FISUMP domain-containing protein [Salinivirgaceae bacterium]|jgi:uncharacterized protein (TIGR02145 family)|nr:FISUMP domain-containing protein [Salinivirgaceae bacterium]
MKKAFFILATLILTISVCLPQLVKAQSPELISYQAVIRDGNNTLVTNKTVGIKISILQSTIDGSVVYSEIQMPQSNSNGLVSFEIGSGESSDNFSEIDWGSGPYFIKTETDPNGGTDYTIVGVSQLLSVPYALYAKTSGSSIPGPQGIQGETGAAGTNGIDGTDGEDGKSAYELAYLADSTIGTEAEWLASLNGADGAQGILGEKGDTGEQGSAGANGVVGPIGPAGVDGLTTSVNGVTQVDGAITLIKADLDLGNVDNTSDANKPVSTANQTALDLKVDKVGSKVLSTNDFTNTDKTNLDANTSKVGYTEALVSANTTVVTNTAKTGITIAQSDAIIANTGKDTTGIYHVNRAALDLVSGTNTGDQNLADVIGVNGFANAQIKNVTNPTDAQDAATKAYVDAIKDIIYDEMLNAGMNGIVKDTDGNTYKTIKTGAQVWMAENLKTTHYANGDAILDGTGVGDISGETEPEYWFAYDDDLNNIATYGRLYTWHTVTDSRNVCPDDWHIPTDAEWTTLIDYLGGISVAGGKLKETGITHWTTPNTDATNETGFTALPGGGRNYLGSYHNIWDLGQWWSATEDDAANAWYRPMIYQNGRVGRYSLFKEFGFAVRCVKD